MIYHYATGYGHYELKSLLCSIPTVLLHCLIFMVSSNDTVAFVRVAQRWGGTATSSFNNLNLPPPQVTSRSPKCNANTLQLGHRLAAVTWLKYCPYDVKLYSINQSINLNFNDALGLFFLNRWMKFHLKSFNYIYSFDLKRKQIQYHHLKIFFNASNEYFIVPFLVFEQQGCMC